MRVTRITYWHWLAVGVVVVISVLFLWRASTVIAWVGGTDLEIDFAVYDAQLGKPIPEAKVSVHPAGGFGKDRDPSDFVLVTDSNGHVKRLCSCMCFGKSGWNVDTYVVEVPEWYYCVLAAGYRTAETTALDCPENIRRVQRGRPSAKLAVEIPLQPVQDNPKG